MLTRFIKELFNPHLRCKRVGHYYKAYDAIIRKRSKLQGLCEDWDAMVLECKYCGHTMPPKQRRVVKNFTTVRIYSSQWDELNRRGYIVIERKRLRR